MKDSKRAIRRAHVERLKKTRKRYWGFGSPYYQSTRDFDNQNMVRSKISNVWIHPLVHDPRKGCYEADERQLGLLVRTPCIYSSIKFLEDKNLRLRSEEELYRILERENELFEVEAPEAFDPDDTEEDLVEARKRLDEMEESE